ncbi:hypothetical protein SEA_SKOG_46 [Gordonia phage Skog]|uniref:Uncharacterized protein n=2 Tax=Caudoviricetes TaxID=2731619 RepID=A0A6G6XJC8_9CAUD|nr:hypothetical protein KHQ83_gp058 [Gordonia phage Pupper]YP_010059296.1 hypothetical protein KHQ85_gp046 [Gordonia phage Skog]QDF18705.1 hypothetical protein SEA_PUPPER_219 [Gordonia phage Pupper]QIG58198.1 hypothetical protein SEA_SKOG_46 [Gordonia phage Skog]
MKVYLLWEQGNEIKEIADRNRYSDFHPKLLDIFNNDDTPKRLAREHNDTHRYTTRWVTEMVVQS